MKKPAPCCTFRIVIGELPQRMLRRAPDERPQLTPWCLLVQRYEQARQFPGPKANRTVVPCVVCSALPDGVLRDMSAEALDGWSCVKCCSTLHAACAESVRKGSVERGMSATGVWFCPVCVDDMGDGQQ